MAAHSKIKLEGWSTNTVVKKGYNIIIVIIQYKSRYTAFLYPPLNSEWAF